MRASIRTEARWYALVAVALANSLPYNLSTRVGEV